MLEQLSRKGFHELLRNDGHLAFADQMIFRFSKAQDCIGAKLFKSFLLAQGENIDRPFLDILNSLEKINMLSVDEAAGTNIGSHAGDRE